MTPRRTALVYLTLAVLLAAAARPVESQLAAARRSAGLTGLTGRRGAAEAVFTSCLGGLRGIIADAIWLRALRMEEEGRHYEIVALLDGLLEMQPHFTSVWAFQAHVLAFDFGSSDIDPDTAESARWIKRGLDVLQQGIERNPTSASLEEQTAYVYLYKLAPSSSDKRWPEQLRLVHPGADRYEGLRRARQHLNLALARKGLTANRKLLLERLAVYCLERMGDWTGAEREWKTMLERRDPKVDPQNATGAFFRNFMRDMACERLILGQTAESREAHRRMQEYFPGSVPGYEELLAGRIRAWHQAQETKRARELYEAMRKELGEQRSYEEIIKPPARAGPETAPGGPD